LIKEHKTKSTYFYIPNLTEFINWQSIFLQKTYSIDAEFFGKMKITKNREQCTETSNVEGKQEHEAPFFILVFIFLSN